MCHHGGLKQVPRDGHRRCTKFCGRYTSFRGGSSSSSSSILPCENCAKFSMVHISFMRATSARPAGRQYCVRERTRAIIRTG